LKRIASCLLLTTLLLTILTGVYNIHSAKASGAAIQSHLISTTDDYYSTSGDSQHHIVTTSTGIIYAIYTRSPSMSGGASALYVKCSADSGQTWVNETELSTISGMGTTYYAQWGSIVVDFSNYLHVVFPSPSSSYPSSQIWYTMSTNGVTWSTPVVISTYSGMSTTAQSGPSLTIDSNNNLHVVWYGFATGYTYKQIWEADCVSGSWSTPVLTSTLAGMSSGTQFFPCIVVDSNNNLDTLWRGTATGYAYSSMWFCQRVSGSWSTPVCISTYPGMNTQKQISPALAIDLNNKIYAAWHGNATGYSNAQIWVAIYDGTTWSTPVRISDATGMAGYPQHDAAIAIDVNNNVYVLWDGEATGYSDYNKIWEANCSSGVWGTPQVLQSAGQNFDVNVQWNSYPGFNIPQTQVNYIFTNGTSSPFNVMFASTMASASIQTIRILADGSIIPSTANLTTSDRVTYTLTGNISSDADGIVIERTSSIVIDGNGYILQGSGNGKGIANHYISTPFGALTIKNLEIRNFSTSVDIEQAQSVTIFRNIISSGIYLTYVSAVTISNSSITGGLNAVFGLSWGLGVVVVDSNITGSIIASNYWRCSLDISRSNIDGDIGEGGMSGDFSIIRNNITGSFGFGGDSSGGTISDNNIMGGIYIQNNEGGSASILRNNVGGGITLVHVFNIVSGGTISENNITTNEIGTGISLYSSGNIRIFENNIYENKLGISITNAYGEGYNIFHNNFINNTQQVNMTKPSRVNTWDDGYPSGGNYWSDYSGTDVKRGPYQNETGSDGIVDTAYVIDANNTDRYPLTKPYAGPHDIGITSLTTSKTEVMQGYATTIGLKIVNYGVNSETLDVTIYANASSIAKFTLYSLGERNSVNFTFDWNTTGFAYGNYTISAEVTPVPGEVDISDNTLIDGMVKVKIPGDINGDGIINIEDATQVGYYWLRGVPPAPPEVDITGDGIVNILDATVIGINWLQHT
jgi:hypothetical protein